MLKDVPTALRVVLILLLLLSSLAYWRVTMQSWERRGRCNSNQVALNHRDELVSLDGYLLLAWQARYAQGVFLTPVAIPLPWRPLQLSNDSSPPFHLVLNEGRSHKRQTSLASITVRAEEQPELERPFNAASFHFGKVLLHEYLFFIDVNSKLDRELL